MRKRYGKPEWFWQAVNLAIFVTAFVFLVLPQRDYLPALLASFAIWLLVAYILFMITHSTAGGVDPLNAEVPVLSTVLLLALVAALLALAGYLHPSAH